MSPKISYRRCIGIYLCLESFEENLAFTRKAILIYISDSYFLLNLVFLMVKQTKPTNHLVKRLAIVKMRLKNKSKEQVHQAL